MLQTRKLPGGTVLPDSLPRCCAAMKRRRKGIAVNRKILSAEKLLFE